MLINSNVENEKKIVASRKNIPTFLILNFFLMFLFHFNFSKHFVVLF